MLVHVHVISLSAGRRGHDASLTRGHDSSNAPSRSGNLKMWKSAAGHNVSAKASAEPDDWETDPDFENDVSEQEQRWGAKTIEGSGHSEHISVAKLREAVSMEHQRGREKEQAAAPQASYGYGGRFGVEKDRMDKGAMGHDFVAEVERHSSQTDAARGFGGKFGVQKDRMDKAALGFEHKEKVEQHASQKDHSKGFGGKYGVEKEKVDRSALGYDYKGETEKHQSQRDYAKGFGGKFGVDKDNVDKAAMGYDYKGETEKHQSQKDYSKGFGGRYGVQTDRVDKSASSFTDMEQPSSAYTKTQPLEAASASAGAGKLKSRFEDMAKASGEENKRRVEEERERRRAREEKEQQETRRRQQVETDREEEREREEERKREEEREQREQREREETQGRQRKEREREEERMREEKREREEIQRREQEESGREELECPGYPQPVPDMEPPAGGWATGEQVEEEEPLYDEPPSLPTRSEDFLDCGPPLPVEQEEPLYDEPPNLTTRSEDFLDYGQPLPVPQEEIEEGDYEDVEPLHPAPDSDKGHEDLTCGQTARALYSYEGDAEDEIAFEEDDIITHIEMVDEGWWRGQRGGRSGLFPAAYVQLVP
ncbi:unnamed protein product [Gadus morhua 'NCC']